MTPYLIGCQTGVAKESGSELAGAGRRQPISNISIGLVKAIEAVELKQKKRDHTPQTKVLEFLVAILAGLP